MSEWLARLRDALGREPREAEFARGLMDDTCRRRTRVTLTEASPGDRTPTTMATTVEQVSQSELVIAQPMAGRVVRPLIDGERLALYLSGPQGRYRGHTTVIGRVVLPSGTAGGRFYGYRVAMPDRLDLSERRHRGRVPVGFDLAPQARIITLDRPDRPIQGYVHDLGTCGCQVRSRNARGRLKDGVAITVRITLPDGEEISETAIVTHTRMGKNPEDLLVGIRFDHENETLQAFVRSVEQRRARRRRSA